MAKRRRCRFAAAVTGLRQKREKEWFGGQRGERAVGPVACTPRRRQAPLPLPEDATDLEEGDVADAPVEVERKGLAEPRQERGPHHAPLLAERVAQRNRRALPADAPQAGNGQRGDEGVGDRLIESGADADVANPVLERRGRRRPSHSDATSGQRRRDARISERTPHLFGDVGGNGHVAAEVRWHDRQPVAVLLDGEAQAHQGGHRLVGIDG